LPNPISYSAAIDPFSSISNFFDSSAWSFVSFGLKVAAVGLWLALVFWTYQDARRRIPRGGLVLAATLLALVIPYLGPLIYVVIRPPDRLADARERELELEELELRLERPRCPDCGHPVESKYLSCPSCLRKLREACSRCGEALDPSWKLCPYCETMVAPGLPPLPSDRLRS
jgi:double zinc ribbon protein